MTWILHQGDVLDKLKTMPDETINCCVTSPPYWGLRDYGVDGQLGLEPTPDEYVAKMVEVFREVKRVLRKDGTCWINLGDSYAGSMKGIGADGKCYAGEKQSTNAGSVGVMDKPIKAKEIGLKPKDLVGIPWRVAFALQADGWYLRSDIIWSKPNPMPESVTDRPTKSHEYIFLLAKSERYYYDAEAIKEPIADSSVLRLAQDIGNQTGSQRVPGKTNGNMKAVGPRFGGSKYGEDLTEQTRTKSGNEWTGSATRNKRTVWSISTKPFSEAHFAVFPPEIPELCIKAGCPAGGVVLDPFAGSGTTLLVAAELWRNAIGIELNPEYCELIKRRMAGLEMSLFENTN